MNIKRSKVIGLVILAHILSFILRWSAIPLVFVLFLVYGLYFTKRISPFVVVCAGILGIVTEVFLWMFVISHGTLFQSWSVWIFSDTSYVHEYLMKRCPNILSAILAIALGAMATAVFAHSRKKL